MKKSANEPKKMSLIKKIGIGILGFLSLVIILSLIFGESDDQVEKSLENKINNAFKSVKVLKKEINDNYNRKDFEKWMLDEDYKQKNQQKIVNYSIKIDSFDKNESLFAAIQIFKKLSKIPEIHSVSLSTEADGVDKYGNTESSIINRITVNKATLKKINWDKILSTNLPEIADYYWERPQFRKN